MILNDINIGEIYFAFGFEHRTIIIWLICKIVFKKSIINSEKKNQFNLSKHRPALLFVPSRGWDICEAFAADSARICDCDVIQMSYSDRTFNWKTLRLAPKWIVIVSVLVEFSTPYLRLGGNSTPPSHAKSLAGKYITNCCRYTVPMAPAPAPFRRQPHLLAVAAHKTQRNCWQRASASSGPEWFAIRVKCTNYAQIERVRDIGGHRSNRRSLDVLFHIEPMKWSRFVLVFCDVCALVTQSIREQRIHFDCFYFLNHLTRICLICY